MLLKLSHNFDFRDLAFRFNISRYTASKYFHQWIEIVHGRLYTKIVFRPPKEELMKTLPMCFRGGEFEDTSGIWDAFEI